MQITGNIKVINETQTFGSKGFKKRELVVTTQDQYPQHILIEFVQDKTDLLNNYKVGDSVKVSININGRTWDNPKGETKYFNSIQGWRIEKTDSVSVNEEFKPSSSNPDDEHDDLPF